MELYLEPIYRDRNCKGQFNKAIRELGKKLIDPDIIAKALLRQE